MKIVCGVCGEDEALVFCCADEAALCASCDSRVHRANKLAVKHRRFSLSALSSESPLPLCDICQKKRGFLFCQEDRAILCTDCDAPIHSANHLTKKHSRFILTGVRISAAPISHSSKAEEKTDKANTTPTVPATDQNKAADISAATVIITPESASADMDQNRSSIQESSFTMANENINTPPSSVSAVDGTTASSTLSYYLMKTCPGWHVEDLLVDDTAAPAFDGSYEWDETLPFMESDTYGDGLEAMAAQIPQVWAPQVPQFLAEGFPPMPAAAGTVDGAAHYPAYTAPAVADKEVDASYDQIGAAADAAAAAAAAERDYWSEDALMVPQISTAADSGKRARSSVWYY